MKDGDLSPRQRDVVCAKERIVVVTGGAGSGKTTAALWAAAQHIQRPDVTLAERVLFLTFSRTAVGLIARRSRAVLTGAAGRIEIHTFHSLSYRLLNAFGRYAGYGKERPLVESEARAKLLGRDGGRFSYDDLIPIALMVLANERVADLISARWSLVVCDEFQDTDRDQWGLLRAVSTRGRLLLLADPNQMIHDWRDGVSAERLEDAISLADRVVELEEASHRDPSGVIPAMAARVREREFGHEAVAKAAECGKLHVLSCGSRATPRTIKSEIVGSRRAGCRSIGVFETTNNAVAELAAELAALGIDYNLIGIPEAQGEGLMAQALLVAHGLDAVPFSEALLQLGVFLTAGLRSREPPPLAVQMRDGAIRSPLLRARLDDLSTRLRTSANYEELVHNAVAAWEGLGVEFPSSAWRRAALSFEGVARRITSRRFSPDVLAKRILDAAVEVQTEALITTDTPETAAVQLMNLHQTKGREADAVILVYREGGYVAHSTEREPFEEKSRLLYVGLTRARQRVVVLLPPSPHPLVAPLSRFANLP